MGRNGEADGRKKREREKGRKEREWKDKGRAEDGREGIEKKGKERRRKGKEKGGKGGERKDRKQKRRGREEKGRECKKSNTSLVLALQKSPRPMSSFTPASAVPPPSPHGVRRRKDDINREDKQHEEGERE